jgi:hypothetical protein
MSPMELISLVVHDDLLHTGMWLPARTWSGRTRSRVTASATSRRRVDGHGVLASTALDDDAIRRDLAPLPDRP